MRKSLLTLSLALMLGAGATAITLATGASAQGAPDRPMMGQAQPGGPGMGRMQRGTPPTPEQRAARRADMCQNLHARVAGQLASLEVRLELTANQRAAFNKWRDTRLAAAKRRADTCASAPMPQGRGAANAATRPSPVERMARQEQMLRQRLADMTAERPALEALYNSLTAEQRQKFTPGRGMGNGPRRGMGRGQMRGRMAMMRDRMGGGPRGAMMQRGPQGGPPPATPAQ